ncbi:beta-lactamase/transpeptidase-like protein [Hyaloraphidium curvatum]|nr:beta-lactamase/transpeptidase-like protein [Hyaloraphidium curvatum]
MSAKSTASHPKLAAALDALLAKGVADGAAPTIAAAVAVNGKLVYDGIAGPAPENPTFWIASMTKMITSVAAIQLVEQGKLDPHAKLSDIFPEMADLRIIEGWDGDSPKLAKAKSQPTPLQLGAHSAGFAYDFFNADYGKAYKALGVPTIFAYLKETMFKSPLMFEPGTDWEYAIGIDFLGLIVEKITGKTLDVALKESIFDKLGMTNTYFDIKGDPRAVAFSLRPADGGALGPFAFGPPEGQDYQPGGHGLRSTPADYLKFLTDLISDSPQLLKKATVDEYVGKNHLGEGIHVKALQACYPYSNVAEFIPGEAIGHSMACAVSTKDTEGMRPAGTLTWAGLANSFFWADPKNGVAAVIACQVFPFCDVKVIPLLHEYEKAVYANL